MKVICMTNNGVVVVGDDELVVRVGCNRIERGQVAVRQRQLVTLPLCAKLVVGEHLHDGRKVLALGGA